MGERTNITWCDATWNPWIGCTKVSPACQFCYAEIMARRLGVKWGAGAPRLFFNDKHWRQPETWNRRAAREGRRLRVFCASMADAFDNEVEQTQRTRLWELIARTPHLDWLLLTKRIGNVPAMLPTDWGDGYKNAWLGISVVTQEEAERDIPKLIRIPATIRFLSCEPLLEQLTLFYFGTGDSLRGPAVIQSGGRHYIPGEPDEYYDDSHPGIDWIICGGESGPRARPMLTQWAHELRWQCQQAGVSFFMKQGSQANWPDFRNLDSFHEGLRVREWPGDFRRIAL